MAVSVDIEYLTRTCFYFDESVKYKLNEKQTIEIYPVSLRDSEFFLSSIDILKIDKNSIPDAKIIQMSYLQFLYEEKLKDKINKQKLFNILNICLKMNAPYIVYDENKKPFLVDEEQRVVISAKQFDEIKRIILYQNFSEYNDEYVNPEFQKNIEEAQKLKNKNVEAPNLERRMAIITAHTGISKKQQMEMTYRSHSMLFQEVYEETEYVTLFPIMTINGKADKMERWIYKNKKNKFEDQVVSVSKFNEQAGGNGQVAQRIVNK